MGPRAQPGEAEAGPGVPKEPSGGGDRVDAGPKAWACEAGGTRPGMGSGGDGGGRGLGGGQLQRPPRVPRPLQPGSGFD